MRKKITEAQFTASVYRHYHGDTLSVIAKDIGVYPSALSELRKRRRTDWERIENRIIDMELGRFQTAKTDMQMRKRLTELLKLVISEPEPDDMLSAVCIKMQCTPSEAQTYIQLFEALFPLKITV